MILIKNKKIKIISIVLSMLLIIGGIGFKLTRAATDIPNLTVSYDSTSTAATTTKDTTINGTVGQEIEVKYKMTPSSLAINDINKLVEKEIVIVIDTSGSMGDSISGSTSRIQALKTAANSFLNKFNGVANVKIGISTYSTEANNDGNSIGLTSTQTSTDFNKLTSKINNLVANGGTNIGDGIRYATKMLQDSTNTTAKKYVILMSDGEPTFYAGDKNHPIKTEIKVQHDGYYDEEWVWHNAYRDSNGKWHSGQYVWEKVWHDGYETTESYNGYEYYTGTEFHPSYNNNLIIAGGGNCDPDGRSFQYAKNMTTKIKELGYSSYEIAYSTGGSADKMKELALAANGKYFSALDSNSINNVFNDIADQIKADYTVENVNFNFSLPDGIDFTGSMADVIIDGNKYIQQLPNIVYRLSDDKTSYVADPFYISLKIKASKSGTYNIGTTDYSLTYKDKDGKILTRTIPTVTYKVSNLALDYDLSKNITDYTDKASLGQTLQMNYTITPKDVAVSTTRKAKQIVLLIDSSYKDKDNISKYLNGFSGISDVTFSLVTYDTGASVSDFGTAGSPQYFANASTVINTFNTIKSTNGTGAANLGEGLRKALFVLNNKTDVNRSIVVFGENKPNNYSYTKAADGTINYYQDIDNSDGSTTETVGALTYGSDATKASDYANVMAQKIVDTKNLAITIFTAGDDLNDDVLKQAASKSSTEFNKFVSDSDVTNLYNITNSDLVLSARINEVLPDGVVFEDNSNTLNRSIKLFYTYDNTSKKYKGLSISIPVNIKATKAGSYDLKNSSLFYTDIEGIELSKTFNNITLNIENNLFIKQGVFNKQNSAREKDDKGNISDELGESYITTKDTNGEIAINSWVRMGALVKVNIPNSTVTVNINSTKSNEISISNFTAKIYKVNDDNTLSETSITPSIQQDGNNYIITFANENNYTERSYIINYNYKVGYANSENEDTFYNNHPNGVTITNNCKIENYDPGDNFPQTIIGLPDLF